MMNSIVLDLQSEIISPNCDIVSVLRKAHLIAVKLGLTEFDKWLSLELNGYHNGENIPEYREVRGILKAFNPYCGWIPAMLDDTEIEKTICTVRVPNSISEIISLSNKSSNGLVSEFVGERLNILNRVFDSPLPMRYAVHLSGTAVGDIVERVKNTILEWTLQLEYEGILGENMQFNISEKERAQSIPQTINNYYGNTNVINSAVEYSDIVAGDSNTISRS